MYSIHLFGTPVIFYHGQIVSIHRRQARRLLYFLITQRNPVHRQKLIDVLWQPADSPHERKKFRSRLRALLGQLRRDLPVDLICSLDQETLQIDARQIAYVDHWTFMDAWQKSKHVLGKYPGAIEIEDLLRTIVAAWHDEYTFLEHQDGDSRSQWQRWLEEERRQLRQVCLGFARATADYIHATGSTPESARWMHIAARHFPDDAQIQQTYLELLQQDGQILEARKYIHALRLRWQQEDLVFPENLLQIERQLSASRRPHRQHTSSPPIVLREKEQAKIRDRFQRGGRLSLSGPEGIGKDTLLRTTLAALKKEYGHITELRLAGQLTEQHTPYQAVHHFLQVYAPSYPRALPAETLSRLRRPLYNDADRIAHSEELSALVYRFLAEQLEENPLIFIVDNAHFLDRQSLGIVERLIHSSLFDRRQRLLVLTYSPEYENPFLKAMLAKRLIRTRLKPAIAIPPFTTEQTRQLVRSCLHAVPRASFLREIQSYTAGNPQKIRALITRLLRQHPREEILRFERLPNVYLLNPAETGIAPGKEEDSACGGSSSSL